MLLLVASTRTVVILALIQLRLKAALRLAVHSIKAQVVTLSDHCS
jgi:hypothetical protein